jgi:hypothetical protein
MEKEEKRHQNGIIVSNDNNNNGDTNNPIRSSYQTNIITTINHQKVVGIFGKSMFSCFRAGSRSIFFCYYLHKLHVTSAKWDPNNIPHFPTPSILVLVAVVTYYHHPLRWILSARQ